MKCCLSQVFSSFSGASLVAVYLIGGFLYQRLIVGAKGMDQIPNYAFWVEVGNLTAVSLIHFIQTLLKVLNHVFLFLFSFKFIRNFTSPSQDGCDFVCRSRKRDESPAYRGVPSDALAEEPEERDDHLLPM